MNRVVDCRASRGLSMVELLVALALGLIITAAVLQMFLASKTTYRMQEALARVQENGRFAIGQLANDIRMAGYMGCGNIDRMQVNIIADPPSDYEFSSTDILSGVENFSSSDSWPSSIRRPLNGSDLFEIRRASSAGVKVIPEHTSNANLKVQGDHGFSQYDILFVTDCSSGDVFKVSNNPKGNGQQGTLTHANNVNTDNRLSKLYGGDAEVMAFERLIYFIANTDRTTASGAPVYALFARSMGAGSGGAISEPYELIEGVENMQIEYGVDTTGDRAADSYQNADGVSDWSRVVSVRVSLLMASSEEKVAPTSGPGAQALTYNGSSVTADGRLRQVFGTVVTIRNRAP